MLFTFDWKCYYPDLNLYSSLTNDLIVLFFLLLQNICTNEEKHYYKGTLNGTIHVVAGGGGASLADFTTINTKWSIFKDYDYGFVKLTAFDHSNLLFEYKKSRDGKVYDSFRISRGYRDILACTVDSCPSSTLASWFRNKRNKDIFNSFVVLDSLMKKKWVCF